MAFLSPLYRMLLAIAVLSIPRLTLAILFLNPPDSFNDWTANYTIGDSVLVRWNTTGLVDGTYEITVTHFDPPDQLAPLGILSEGRDGGKHTWIVGDKDGVNNEQIAKGYNFCLRIFNSATQDMIGSSGAFEIKSKPVPSPASTSGVSTSTGPKFSTATSTNPKPRLRLPSCLPVRRQTRPLRLVRERRQELVLAQFSVLCYFSV